MIKSTENFDMVVMFDYTDREDGKEELLGIEELEQTLENVTPVLYIKETESIDVVLVELGTDSVEVANKINNTPTKIISRVVPINTVVGTSQKSIINKIKELSVDLTKPNDTFLIKCYEENKNNINCQKIRKHVMNEFINMDLTFSEKNPKWVVYIEIIGENTGLSILESSDFNENNPIN
ncbi:THUMP domain-containing protein [Methanobacterium sp. SMA-27]|uniref:THUMP domain-containing protein n=1 Tax=Methanobacterium sp. SMA-27 TaxID=1495336 RepID=UPI00064E884D|nr:THUMP domain-containing protein [Methanobacterium sp. SMA-27]